MFTKLCSAGLTAFIGFQALVNIGGTTRALPMTGITLPFVSHGGFSLITSFAMLGMLLAFSHRNASDAEPPRPPPRPRLRSAREEEDYRSRRRFNDRKLGTAFTIEAAAVTDRGLSEKRPHNEDSMLERPGARHLRRRRRRGRRAGRRGRVADRHRSPRRGVRQPAARARTSKT